MLRCRNAVPLLHRRRLLIRGPGLGSAPSRAEYADRKNDEEEYVADSLLYDRRHLPRTAPAPECVARFAAEEAAAAAAAAAGQQQAQQGQETAAAAEEQPAAAGAGKQAAAAMS